jgi:hypothetical protein
VPELRCFYSRASFEAEVLGVPYQVRLLGFVQPSRVHLAQAAVVLK